MGKKKNVTDTEKLVDTIIEGIREKKGRKIVSLNLTKLENVVSEYFIICHADSNIQVNAIANSVEEFSKKKLNKSAWHKEGFENLQWILLDYVNVVVHIFQYEHRKFYNLEDLWADAEIKSIIDKQ